MYYQKDFYLCRNWNIKCVVLLQLEDERESRPVIKIAASNLVTLHFHFGSPKKYISELGNIFLFE